MFSLNREMSNEKSVDGFWCYKVLQCIQKLNKSDSFTNLQIRVLLCCEMLHYFVGERWNLNLNVDHLGPRTSGVLIVCLLWDGRLVPYHLRVAAKIKIYWSRQHFSNLFSPNFGDPDQTDWLYFKNEQCRSNVPQQRIKWWHKSWHKYHHLMCCSRL